MAIAATLLVTSAALGAWNAPVVMRPATFEPTSPDLGAWGPNVVAAWNQPAVGPNPASVWVARSTTSGTTFGPPTRLAFNGANPAHDITVFSASTSHFAVWSEQVSGGGSRIFMSRTTFGGAWTAAVQISPNSGMTRARNPRLAITGTVFILVYQANSSSSGPFSAYTRTRVGSIGPWGSASLLPGGAPLGSGGASLAVSATRVLVAWTNGAGTVKERRGNVGGSGTTLSWLSGDPSLGTGTTPRILIGGTHAVVLWANNADIYRKLSANSGGSWGSQVKILDGTPSAGNDAGLPYRLYDAAMSGARIVVTVATGDSPELGGAGYRMASSNSGLTWTKTTSFAYLGDERQVAFTKVSGITRLAEAWLQVSLSSYPWALRYHREA